MSDYQPQPENPPDAGDYQPPPIIYPQSGYPSAGTNYQSASYQTPPSAFPQPGYIPPAAGSHQSQMTSHPHYAGGMHGLGVNPEAGLPLASQPQGFHHAPPRGPMPGFARELQPTSSYQPMQSSMYPSQPAGYQPYQPTVHIHRWMRISQIAECVDCGSAVTTTVKYVAGPRTWFTSCMCVLGCCWAGCCLIPFCVDIFKDVQHLCPNCNRILGESKMWQ